MPANTSEVFIKLPARSFNIGYTLVGRTAFAIQIRHQLPEDLDFILDGEKLNVTCIK